MLRFIDRLNGIENADELAKNIKKEIKMLGKQPNSLQNRKKIKRLYEKLDEIQYKPDYMCLIIDKEKDYWRACKGFKINGIKYVRLLGTNGGIKCSTIVFVSERLAPELRRLIDNGRNKSVELVPAKLEAYQALVCSGSIPVSMPNGIAVVDDCVTHFKSDIINIEDADGEPKMWFQEGAEIELDESDGYGIMLPSLARRWSEELQLDYMVCGVNTRLSFEKGMVFTFDFLEFADKVAGTRIIKDAWGNEVDLSNVELVLTTSMVKLWDSYKDCDDYIRNCVENGYTFGITKSCPKELESERMTNYQFLQVYDLDESQINELIHPTMQEIHDILSLDWRKAVLFLKGSGLTEDNIDYIESDFAKAIMIDQRMMDDPFITRKIYALIKKRIMNAKIGVIKTRGNYSIISGDPYALCQNMFGLEVTGILKAGEIYNHYWLERGVDKVVCFRAPMTCANNVVRMDVNGSEEARHWYQYMTACTLLNAWDTTAAALNGADKDGDLVFTTDNRVLVECHKQLPTLMCAQRRAKKCIPTEEDIIRSNIATFGDDIGKITNHITSMFDVIAQYEVGSREYEVLDYRIKCGQKFQQDSIDKAKGIISKPMPKGWYDRASVRGDGGDEDTVQFNMSITADKKPYFMRYIYPTLMRQYNTYISNTNKKALREFRMTVEELMEKERNDGLTKEESEFMYYYRLKIPVGMNNCVVNRICRRFEEEFDRYISRHSSDVEFDYTIMKSGVEYSQAQYNTILMLYKAYNRRVQDYMQYSKKRRLDEDEHTNLRSVMVQEFRRECQIACPNKAQLCDILLDICYQKEGSKQFVWDIAGDIIIETLLKNNNGCISFPVRDENGDIAFGGETFTLTTKRIGGEDSEYCIK